MCLLAGCLQARKPQLPTNVRERYGSGGSCSGISPTSGRT